MQVAFHAVRSILWGILRTFSLSYCSSCVLCTHVAACLQQAQQDRKARAVLSCAVINAFHFGVQSEHTVRSHGPCTPGAVAAGSLLGHLHARTAREAWASV